MEEKFRAFKGIWIPREVWFNKELNWTEKFLLMEINSLDNENGCSASNGYFADFFSISETQISIYISNLKKKNYIYQEIFNGRQRILRSRVKVDLKSAFKKTSSLPLSKLKVYNKDNNKDDILEPKGSNTSKARQDSFKEIDKLTGIKRNGGNPEVDYLIDFMKEKFDLSILDGTQSENRKYCWLAMQKFKSDGIKLIIEAGSVDSFWKNKITGFRSLYYHGVKIASTLRKEGRVGIINV